MRIGSVKWIEKLDHARRVRPRLVGLALITAVSLTADAAAQEDEPIPTVPPGTPAVLFPIQAALPTPGGSWPGGAASEQELLETLHAEIAFAFAEQPDAETWALPDDLVRRLRQNPTLRVNPFRLAYQALLRKPKKHEQIPEPLHSQMRQVAALFNARLVVLPMRVWYEPEQPDGRQPEGEMSESGGEFPGGVPEARGRLVLLAAVIDARRSAVLWHGEIEGAVETPDSSLLLTSLAFRLADHLIP